MRSTPAPRPLPRTTSTPNRLISPWEPLIRPQRQRARSLCSDSLAGPVRPTAQQAIDLLLKEAQSTQLELLNRGFDFEIKLGESGFECVIRRGSFSVEEHASLLLRHAIADETCGNDGLAAAVWHFLAEELGVTVSGDGVLSDIEHFMEHDPEAFGAHHEIGHGLTSFDVEPGRTRIAAMTNKLMRRMDGIPLERRTPSQALALLHAKLLCDSLAELDHPMAATHARLTQLPTMIDCFPEGAQVARLALFHQGFDFDMSSGTSGVECVVRSGRFNVEEHASLLLRYAIAIQTSDHAPMAVPVFHFLLANGTDRARIAAVQNQLRRRIEGIPLEHRTSNQAQALIDARLWLGSCTDLFQELFKDDPVGACSVARTLKLRRHEKAGSACMSAILLAAKVAVPLLATAIKTSTTPEQLRTLRSAVIPLLPQLSEGIREPVTNLFNTHLPCLEQFAAGEYWHVLEKGIAACKTTNEIEALLRDDLLMLLLDNWAERT